MTQNDGPLCELLGQPSSQQKIHLDENEHSSRTNTSCKMLPVICSFVTKCVRFHWAPYCNAHVSKVCMAKCDKTIIKHWFILIVLVL